MFDRKQFLTELRGLAGQDIRWLHQGTIPETGFDCIGVVRYAAEQQGVVLPEGFANEFEHYGRPPDGQRFLSIMRKWLTEISIEETLPGDLFVIYIRRNPCHLAVKMENGMVAEAFESMDGSVSRFLIRELDPRHRIAACFRIPDFVGAS